MATFPTQSSRWGNAGRDAKRALDFAIDSGFRGSLARALLLLGDIDARHDPPNAAEAEDHYRRALELAEELGMRPLAAHCHLGLGRLCRQRGGLEKSGTHLETAMVMYRDMNRDFWLDEAQAEMGAPG